VRVFTGFERPDVSYDQQWDWCVQSLRECARRAADWGVTIGVQNHHDIAAHYESLYDLLKEIDHPNCKAMFDAWSPALQGTDLVAAVNKMAPFIVHTTVADYVRRPRFHYQPRLVNYVQQPDVIRAVPMGEGFIDYASFFYALKANDYDGYVAYEMCSVLEGGGSEENLERCARQFIEYMKAF
jgi:sugar phosphate isomerase/epimerase